MEMVACGLFGDFWFEYVSDFLVLVVGLSLGFDGGEKDREAVSNDLASPTVDMPKPPMRNSGKDWPISLALVPLSLQNRSSNRRGIGDWCVVEGLLDRCVVEGSRRRESKIER
ncbi:unnamed protein product [Linum trigynum]|uniref:Uncharacterized protein n=1 Tax=Linum trigynum TaxID=586398 RepID=A0AAV2G0I0_9ROSI